MAQIETELHVEGMSCGGCAASVTKAVEALEGVERAEVDHAAGRARIWHDPQRSPAGALAAAVEAAGFDVRVALPD